MVPMEQTASKTISEKQVEHQAELARLELTEEEKRRFTEQLNTILEYFRILDHAETEGVPPTLSILDLENVWRPDQPRPSMPVEKALSNVPKTEKGFVRAPRIV